MRSPAAIARQADAPFTVEDIEIDTPRPDEVLVRMVASGICQSDLTFKSRLPAGSPPAVLGHEGAGVVEALGADVRDIELGDHVVLSFRHCERCEPCNAGRSPYCAQGYRLNMTGRRPDGSAVLHQNGDPLFGSFMGQSSFAGYAIASPDNIVVVDRNIDLAVAAPFGCSGQTGAGAVLNVLQPGTEASLVVFGVGAVGLAGVMAAAAKGVRTVVAVDPVASRRELAERVGATATLDPADADVVAALAELTRGGATHAMDTSGIPDVIADGVRALASGGTLVVVALGPPQVNVSVRDLILNGKTLRGSAMGDAVSARFIPDLLKLHVSGHFPMDQLVTTYKAADINQAVADAASGATVKPVLLW